MDYNIGLPGNESTDTFHVERSFDRLSEHVGPERREILYSGIVQGVGFRWATLRALEGLALTGYVRNLRDGRVEVVLEGEPGVVDQGLGEIRRALDRYIQDESQAASPATGEFTDLSIRR